MVPLDSRDGYIWFNGELIDWKDARIHVLTHGLHYGSCVFEGERAYEGEVFKLREHTERLHFSAKILGFNIPYSVDEIDAAHAEVLKANNLTNAYIRPVAWRGSEAMGLSAPNNRINMAIAAWEWPSYFTMEARLAGIKLTTSNWRRPPANCAPTNSKAAGLYMICTLSKHAAEKNGFHDALMLDYRGQVAEATGANIFLFMEDGKVHTPTPDCFLNGITRRTVLELLKKRGYEVVERAIMPEEFAQTKEVFLTGTAAEVTPVSRIDDFTFTPADLCKTMMEDYDALVRRKG